MDFEGKQRPVLESIMNRHGLLLSRETRLPSGKLAMPGNQNLGPHEFHPDVVYHVEVPYRALSYSVSV